MNAMRSVACALVAIAALVNSGRARAAVEEGAVVRVHVVAPPAEARATREVLADLLSRIGIGFADGVTTPPLVDVEIDLSTGRGGPSVTLTTREPPVLICRRLLSPQASREVLIESAAEVAYAAVESRARALGAVRERSPAAGPQSDSAPVTAAPQPEVPAIIDAAAPALHKQVASPVAMPGYGVDVAAFGEMQLRDAGATRSAAGGGAAVSLGLRGLRLDPALTLGVSYLRAVGVQDPAAPANVSMVSTRLGATVAALAFRWISLQLGPSLSLDFVQGDAPVFMTGMGPQMMPAPGAQSFSGLAVWAGGSARFAVRVTQSSHVFVAAGADYQLRQAGPARATAAGPPIGGVGMTGQWMDAGPSGWRSSLVVGLGFTLAGRPLMTE